MFSILRQILDTTDPTASMRHAAFGLVVVCACGWLSFALYRSPMDATWLGAFTALLGTVGATKVLGSKVGVAAPTSPGELSSGSVAPATDSQGLTSPGGRKDV